MDALLDRFIEAVQRSDKEALNSLRLTREEYEEIIVPGRVPPGSPPRQVTRMVTRHFWEMLDYKTSLFVDVLLERFGGKTLERGEVRFTKKPESYDWYRTWGQVRQTATEPDGTVHVVKTGSIAEVGGRYKFVSFQWDN